MRLPVYMDCNATTQADPRVVQAMLPFFTETFGNPSSRTHEYGWRAEEAVETARARVASLIGAQPKEIIFTSGATESNNIALIGAMQAHTHKGDHLITCVTEHKAVLDVCKYMEEAHGIRVTYLPVDARGLVDTGMLRAAITPRTVLISIMYANNEIGTIQPITDIGEIAHEYDILFHVDGAQACGKIPVDVIADQVSLLSISGHKLYAPKGVGALFAKRRPGARVRLAPQMFGGGQERSLRPGTLNVPGIVGLGKACHIAAKRTVEEAQRLRVQRDNLLRLIRAELPDVIVNGTIEQRLPGNLNVSFPGVEGESLIMGMRDVAVSSGSACTSGSSEPSYVLRAIGVSNELAHASIRFGLVRFTTDEEVSYVARRVTETVKRLRSIGLGEEPQP